MDGSTDEKLSKKPMKSFNQAETVADMKKRQRFPNVKSEKSYEGTVMIYRHKTKPNLMIESEPASKIESVIEKRISKSFRVHYSRPRAFPYLKLVKQIIISGCWSAVVELPKYESRVFFCKIRKFGQLCRQVGT